MNGFEIVLAALGAAVAGAAAVALARVVLGRYVARALRRQYPLLPLTASLAAHGWMLASAIITHAGYEAAFEESDEERRQAVEDAFKLGWAGARLDDLLDSWIGEG